MRIVWQRRETDNGMQRYEEDEVAGVSKLRSLTLETEVVGRNPDNQTTSTSCKQQEEDKEKVKTVPFIKLFTFADRLDIGYETLVGERGVQISGGQKQWVAIAHAIVKGPKILLLDEASALDAESEKVVQDTLDRVMVNRTSVVVAHRLSAIKSADVIAVVKNGVIVEKGKHDTLVNSKDGFYASLFALHMSTTTT